MLEEAMHRLPRLSSSAKIALLLGINQSTGMFSRQGAAGEQYNQ